MANKKMEFLARIKPILDKSQAKKDTEELAEELQDVLSATKIGFDADSLKELGDLFNEKLKELGKKPIVFSDIAISDSALKEITIRFTQAISDGIKAGINNGVVEFPTENISKQFDALKNRRNELHEEAKKLDRKFKKYEYLADVTSMAEDEFKPLKADSNIDEQAHKIMGAFVEAEDALNGATRGTKEYQQALIKALDAASNLYRMSRTLEQNKEKVKDKTLLTDFDPSNLSDIVYGVFEKADSDYSGILKKLDKAYHSRLDPIVAEIKQIDIQIESLQQNDIEVINQEKAQSALKTLKEIEEAYNRILNKDKSVSKTKKKDILSAVEYKAGDSSLAKISHGYKASVEAGESWEKQYQWIVKFVKEYDAYRKKVESEGDSQKRANMKLTLKAHTPLYEEFLPMFENAENALRNILNMADGIPLVGAGGINDETAPAPEDAANAEKIAEAERLAREETEKKAQAEEAARKEAELKAQAEQKAREEAEASARAREAETSFDKLDELSDKAYEITDAEELNRILQERKAILDSIHESVRPDYEEEIELQKQTNAELEKRVQLLRDAQNGLIDVDSIDDIIKENGTLESKLERLGDVSYDWGMKIKDGEEDEAIDELEAFEETYDRIILKLANGRNIEILPNAKGLRQLYKYQDGLDPQAYGETEIDDVVFERKKKEVIARQENTEAIEQERLAQEKLNAEKKESVPAISEETPQTSSAPPDGGAKVAIDTEALKGVLEQITYNVKVVQDTDAPDTQQNNGNLQVLNEISQKVGERIAQDQTLQEIKGMLQGIGSGDNSQPSTPDVKHNTEEIDTEIEQTHRVVKNFKEWLLYLDSALDDDKYKTSGKKEATEQLRKATEYLVDYRRNPERYAHEQYPEDRLNIKWMKAYFEAQRQNVSPRTLSTYRTDVEGHTYEDSLKKFQEERAFYANKLQEKEKELALLQQKKNQITSNATDNKVAIDTEALKGVLSQITYNVKIANDDADKTANKIALDDSTLKQTLQDVFKNILNPITEQNDGNTQAPWALEKTLSTTIKGVLDTIQTNTSKIGTAEAQQTVTIDANSISSVANDLTAIKTAVEAINSKVVQGTKATTSSPKPDDSKKSTKEKVFTTAYSPERIETQKLSLKKFRTELETSGRLTEDLKQRFKGLAISLSKVTDGEDLAKWNEKFKQFKLEIGIDTILNKYNDKNVVSSYQELIDVMKTRNKLELQYEKAKDGSEVKRFYQEQLAQMDRVIAKQNIVKTNEEQEARLAEIKRQHEIELGAIRAKKLDETTAERSIQQKQQEAETVRQLVDLYEQLGRAQALGEDTTSIRANIKSERDKLSIVDYATDMKFKHAKNKGSDSVRVAQENERLNEQKHIIASLKKLYEEYGALKERASAVQGEQLSAQLSTEVDDTLRRIQEAEKLLNEITPELRKTFDDAYARGKSKETNKQYEAAARSMDAERAKQIETLAKKYEQLGKAQAKFAYTGSYRTQNEIDELEATIESEKARLNLTAEQIANMQTRLNLAREEARLNLEADDKDKIKRQYEKEEAAALKKEIAQNKKDAGLGLASSALSSGRKAIGSLWQVDGVDVTKITSVVELDKALEELSKTQFRISQQKGPVSKEDTALLQTQTSQVALYTQKVKDLVANFEKFSGDNTKKIGSLIAGTDIKTQMMDAVAMLPGVKAQVKSYNSDTQELTYTVKTGANAFTEYTVGIRQTDNALVSVQGTTKTTETFFESFKKKLGEIFRYFSASSVIFKVVNEVKKGIQYIREIDSALTELKKVTDETEETYDKFLDTASKTAAKVGSTIKEVVSSTADWARLGYSMEQAAKFAESTQILMNVSEFTDVSKATDTLISAVQAFGYTAETSIDVVDLLNTIGNNYAISTADLAQSLTKSSASLVAAGGDLAEAAALTATANKIIQDADSVGTALKTTSLRLRGTDVKVLEEEGLDSDGAVTSKSKLQSKVKALSGVDILTATGEYKSTYEILSQIADVWKDINDMDQAALLELISGKRNSSVIAAILQNPEELKAAFEDANNASGSALKENEKYLDSIQGKIDQFTNALQTMWNNVLDDDVIKWFVNIATQLIKILDKLGPIKTLIAGIAVFLNKKYNFIDFSKIFAGFKEAFSDSKGPKDFFKKLISGFKDTGFSIDKAREKLEDLKKKRDQLGDPKLEKNKKKYDKLTGEITSIEAEIKAQRDELVKNRTAAKAQMDAANAELGHEWSQAEFGMADEAELDKLKKKADEAKEAFEKADLEVKNFDQDVKTTGKTGETAFAKLGKGVKAFAGQVASVITQMLIMLAITKLIEVVTQAFDDLITTAEEAAEAYEELNNELDTLQDNLENIKNEISEIDDKMAALIAKDSLSFTEKEELERLRAEREELERTLELNQQLANQKQQQVNNQTSDQVEYYKNKGVKTGKTSGENVGEAAGNGALIGAGVGVATGVGTAILGSVGAGAALGAWAGPVGMLIGAAIGAAVGAAVGAGIGAGISASEETIGESIDNMEANLAEKEKAVEEARKKYQASGSETDKENYEKAQKELSDYKGEMATYFQELGDYYDNVDLSVIEDPDEYKRLKKEMNDFYNERDKWLIENRAEGAESNAIERIFNKDDYEGASDEIDALVGKLEKDPSNQNIISQIGEYCKVAEEDLKAVGLSVQDATDYFTMLAENAAFGTIEGKTEEIVRATSKLKTLLSNTKSTDFTSLFGQGGEVSVTAIAEYFKGTSEATRTEIAKLVKSINDGEITVQQAMKSFAAYGMVESWKIVETQVSELNTEVFKDLGDEISGVINTVKELSAAFENVASSIDLVSQAEAEMAYSGHLSVETALQLMESTDDWNKVLKIEEGNIKLVDGAEQVLVQTKLDLIKKNLQTALSTVEAQLAQITATESSADLAYTIEESTNLAVTQLAGNMAYLTEMMTAYTRAAAGENVDMSAVTKSAEAAKAKVLADTDYKKNAAEAIGREELEKEKARLQAMLDMYETVDTPREFKNNYSSDEVSGGSKTKEDAEKSLVDNMLDEFERRLNLITNERDLIEAEIDKMEAQGGKASAQYYEDLIRNSNEEKALLQEKKKYLEDYLKANKDNIDPEAWTEYNNELNETAVAIKECETNTIEWVEALREIDLHYFEQATDEISRLGEEIDFVNSLLEDEDIADENGNWSSAGLTRLGLYVNQMEIAAANAQRYQEEIDKLNAQYTNGELSEEQYQERLSDLVSSQQDAIQSYEDAKDGIVELNEARIDAIKDGIDKEIEAYEDLINLKKEELDAERDLYDFRKNVKKQTKDISTLERRIAALSGSTAASDVAERRKLQAQLNEAREGLNDTYYERSRDQQSQALDDEAEAYRESKEKYIEQLEEQLKDTETLIQNSMMDVLLNADSIYTELNGIADTYGITLSGELTQPWKDASAQATAWKNELQNSMTSGEYAALIGEGGAITAFANGVATKMKGSWNTAQNAVKGYADFLTGAELGNKFRSTITGFGNQIQTIIDKWNGVKLAADAAYEAQNRKVTVGGVNTNTSSNNNTGGTKTSTTSSSSSNVAALQAVLNTVFSAGLVVDGKMGSATTNALRTAQSKLGITADGKYGSKTRNAIISYIDRQIASWRNIGGGSQVGQGIQAYLNAKNQLPLQLANGTMGLKEDRLAITDESWIGEEITLAAGKNGQLQYLKKGSAVMPADISANLIEWGRLNPDMLKVGGGANLNMISNAINKPEINLDIAEFLHVDKVDKDTMPELEKFVDKKMNELVRQLNYSIKKFK